MFSKIMPAFAGSVLAAETLLIDITHFSLPDQITTLACAGLMNRTPSVAGSVYTINDDEDQFWWDTVLNKEESKDVKYDDLVSICMNSGLPKGYINWNPVSNNEIIPEMITLAGVHDSIPFPGRHTVPPLADGSVFPLTYDCEI